MEKTLILKLEFFFCYTPMKHWVYIQSIQSFYSSYQKATSLIIFYRIDVLTELICLDFT